MGKSFQQRLDGFVNVLTGLGGRRDKRLYAEFEGDPLLDSATLENLYNNNDLAHTIVSIYPDEALRQGWDINLADDEEGERAADLLAQGEDLGVCDKVKDAACWGRLYGGGAIFLGVTSGRPDSPLNEEMPGSLEFLTVFDKTELQPSAWYSDLKSPKFGKPEKYRLTPSVTRGGAAPTNVEIHESRLVILPGEHTTKRQKNQNNGWDNSVLQLLYGVIRDFDSGFSGASLLLNDASQAVYGVEGLLEILASDNGQELLNRRMQMIELCRSVARAMVIDTKETFERKTTSFSGIPEILDRMVARLSAATGIPVTVLMGQAPAGLNATGASDVRLFYDRVASYQKKVILPALERIYGIILRSQGVEPKNWSIVFESLYQPTETESAQTRKLVADTDAVYITQGVLTPEEVALNRFGPGGWSAETQIDLTLRKELDAIKAEKMLEQAENPETLADNPGQLTPMREPPKESDEADPTSP